MKRASYEKGLVTVLTPTFNYGHFLSDLLKSVLRQDYPALEMIIVDDGSTDGTKRIVELYADSFERHGYRLTYIYQPNGGQSAAINNGLKHVKGEYLVWPDADDRYSSDSSISQLVAMLENAPEDVGAVRCLPSYTGDEESAAQLSKRELNTKKERLFEDSMRGDNGFWYLSGGYMVRMECLDRCIPGREIAVARHAGQNYQLLMPLLYHYRCLTLERRLITIRRHSDSHSSGRYRGYGKLAGKNDDFEKVMLQTLQNIPGMPEAERERYFTERHAFFTKEKLRLAKEFSEVAEVRRLCLTVIREKLFRLTFKDKLWFAATFIPFSAPAIRAYKILKS